MSLTRADGREESPVVDTKSAGQVSDLIANLEHDLKQSEELPSGRWGKRSNRSLRRRFTKKRTRRMKSVPSRSSRRPCGRCSRRRPSSAGLRSSKTWSTRFRPSKFQSPAAGPRRCARRARNSVASKSCPKEHAASARSQSMARSSRL